MSSLWHAADGARHGVEIALGFGFACSRPGTGPRRRLSGGQVLTPPADLRDPALAASLESGWGLTVAAMTYRAVGWGSHHWDVTGTDRQRWFVTVDELENKRHSESEPLAAGFGRLRGALAAAGDLQACGRPFVVAPVPARDGEPLTRVGGRFGVAVYPFIDGQSFEWGEFTSPEHRLGVLGMLAAVHAAPAAARRNALTDDFAVPCRDAVEAACDGAGVIADCGPASPIREIRCGRTAAGC